MAEELNNIIETEYTGITPETENRKNAYLDKLLNTYDKIFDMEIIEASDIGLKAKAHYMEAAKKAFMRAQRHEYVYIFDINNLDKTAFEKLREYSLNDGLNTIQPAKGYLSSFITVVILTASAEQNVKPLIEHHRHMQNLKKQKKGYVNQRICAVNFSDNVVIYNKDSKELGVFLQNFFPETEAQTE
ncbi:MAG: hypothetical protein ACOX7J_05545 [Bacillota bacterium]|jgi:hypothetical protein